ncbi:MAG: DUF2877 domain-containing protein [Burkholderiales bacterium]
MTRVLRIGERARQALARSGGKAAPLAAFADGPYFDADGDLIWVGARLPAMHPRAVITAEAQPRGVALQLAKIPERGWTPSSTQLDIAAAGRIFELTRALTAGDVPRGFGPVLAGGTPTFPLDLAEDRVQALARAYASDEPASVLAASIPLLGFGIGLTPSGDDLAGAALFGRRLLAPEQRAWADTAEQLAREIETRSHLVSAALFGDLVRGETFAPLHAIAEALAVDDHTAALTAARELVAIGHSSGWDMFTGLAIGITGRCAPGTSA